MTLTKQRRFVVPMPEETLEQLAARALPDEPAEAAQDNIKSWNLHIFAMRRPRGLLLGSDVVFVEPAEQMSEAVIVGAEIAAGHDGAADLVLSVRYQNGVIGPVVLDAETALQLMSNCGVANISELAGHSCRNVLEKS